jgi:hypothetical protein
VGRRHSLAAAAAVLGGLQLACTLNLPTPTAPKGQGWATSAQGYRLLSKTYQTQTYGNTTVTSTSVTSSLQNAALHERPNADAHETELAVGKLVDSVQLNRKLAQRMRLELKPAVANVVGTDAESGSGAAKALPAVGRCKAGDC